MKVLFVPEIKSNKYLDLLRDALHKEGIETKAENALSVFSLTRQAIREGNVDIIHITWTHPFFISESGVKSLVKAILFILDLCILKILRMKVVWTVHNRYNHEMKFKRIDISVGWIIARICDIIKVECNTAKSEIIKLFGVDDSKIKVIPEGNYINAYPNTISKEKSREKLGFSISDFVFLFIGQIRPYKGCQELINVFRMPDFKNTRLLIVGKPHTQELARELLSATTGVDNIRLIFNFIPDEELQVYMNAADVVVLPYRDVLTSGVVVLALSFGKPVVVPKIGCISDIIDEKGNILYDISDVNGLYNAMIKAMNADISVMSEHNFRVAQRMNWNDIAKKMKKMYTEVSK